jgi:hypothetical protein
LPTSNSCVWQPEASLWRGKARCPSAIRLICSLDKTGRDESAENQDAETRAFAVECRGEEAVAEWEKEEGIRAWLIEEHGEASDVVAMHDQLRIDQNAEWLAARARPVWIFDLYTAPRIPEELVAALAQLIPNMCKSEEAIKAATQALAERDQIALNNILRAEKQKG